jgi:hypothetical protein
MERGVGSAIPRPHLFFSCATSLLFYNNMALLKTHDDYQHDPGSKLQESEYLKGLAEKPLPKSADDAMRLSLVNGHTLFRGASGYVRSALDDLDPAQMDDIEVEIPKRWSLSSITVRIRLIWLLTISR